ncbi:unnamed protein product [Paramecium primaurelia]|uniref:Casein kinase I n=1 Tax=Paramecium primaurelia TaxID=5886 RepID=A0A8S1MQL4_PARPR|nr:unnamed protein product [Paramecium primaurelia]
MYLQTSKFEVLSMIGQSSAHQVFKAQHNLTSQLYAIKMEKCPNSGQIENEFKVLKELDEIEGIPKIINYGMTPDNKSFLIMPLLNCNLHDVLICQELSLSQVLAIGLNIIETLEKIHLKQILHLDIKPENIMLSQTIQNTSIDQLLKPGFIQIIDFGLSQSLENLKNQKNLFIGSLNFASRASHKGEYLSFKDDLESLLYVLVYLRNYKLPWSQLISKEFTNSEIKSIGEMKTSLFNKIALYDKFPQEFLKFMSYIDTLKQDKIPDYSYVKSLFITMLQTKSSSQILDQFQNQTYISSIIQAINSETVQIPVQQNLSNQLSIENQLQEDIIENDDQMICLSDMIWKYSTVKIKSILDIKY